MNDVTIDIQKIIDEAMEKKDRSVSIFISPVGTTVNVSPYSETKPHWIRKVSIYGNLSKADYVCSSCGFSTMNPSRFCPICGEALTLESKEDPKDD